MSAIGDKLRARRDIDPDRVDETELDAIDNAITGTEATLIGLADKHQTRDSMPLISFIRLAVETIAESTTPAKARAQLKQFENGEIAFIQLGGNTEELERQLAEANAEKQRLADDLKAMQDAATGTSIKALGGSPTDSIMEEIKTQVSGDPDRAKGILDLFKQLSGLDEKEYKARAAIMGRVAFASPDWNLVPDPGTGEMLPSIFVGSKKKKEDAEKALAVAEKALIDEQNAALAGSLANQLDAAEKQLDPANTNGWAAKLAAVQQELTDERDAALATSLAGKLKQVEDDLKAAQKAKDDAIKVLDPISKAAKAADTAMNGALANLADGKFMYKRLVPANVRDARDQIGAAKLALHQAQNPTP